MPTASHSNASKYIPSSLVPAHFSTNYFGIGVIVAVLGGFGLLVWQGIKQAHSADRRYKVWGGRLQGLMMPRHGVPHSFKCVP